MLPRFSRVAFNTLCKNSGWTKQILFHIPPSGRGVHQLYARSICVASKHFNKNKPQYEYDPNTDTFRPKHQQSFTFSPSPLKVNKKEQAPFIKFLRRWTRTVFLITGGIVWGGLLFVSLFVDVKESTESLLPHDLDDEVRMMVFYNLAHGKDDLARIVAMHRDENGKHEHKLEDFHHSMHNKQDVLMKTIDDLKSNDKVIELLGNPVQLCGYRVANKIGDLIHEFQELAARYHESKEHCSFQVEGDEQTVANTWTAQCFLEGSKAIASLDLSFSRTNIDSDWTLDRFSLQKMENTGHVYSDQELLSGTKFC